MKYEVKDDGKLHLMRKAKRRGGGGGGGAGGGVGVARYPMENAANFAPVVTTPPRVFTDSFGPIDLHGPAVASGLNMGNVIGGGSYGPLEVLPWITVKTYDTAGYRSVVVSADVETSPVLLNDFSEDTPNYLHAEIQIIGRFSGNSCLLTRSAVNRTVLLDEVFATGFFRFEIFDEEIPDQIEIQAREVNMVSGLPGDDDDGTMFVRLTGWAKFIR